MTPAWRAAVDAWLRRDPGVTTPRAALRALRDEWQTLTEENAILKARLAEAARPGPWRPIETAPRDGTWVLLSSAGWTDGQWEIAQWSRTSACWQTYDAALLGATHWLPLPPRPTTQTETER